MSNASNNHPKLKLIEKHRIGSKYVKKYDKPKTPYQRLMESSHLSIFEKEKLRLRYEGLNPITLKKELNKAMASFRRKISEGRQERYGVAC